MEMLLQSLLASGWKNALCTNSTPVYVNNILDGPNFVLIAQSISAS